MSWFGFAVRRSSTNVNGQTQTHGLDGNVLTMQLSSTAPIIQNGCDSENRMTSTQTSDNTRIDNRYDPLHRRVLKQVSTWDSGSSTWVLKRTVRLTYEGWNMIEEGQRCQAFNDVQGLTPAHP